MQAKLAHVAPKSALFPSDGLLEVAVLGRSNVGKSTLINRLLGRRSLARTSGRPGKTRAIHFYLVEGIEPPFYVVDLPGFGYAAVARSERRAWQPLVESYLRASREPLRGAFLLVDVRRGLRDEEERLLEWLEAEDIPLRVVLTKGDKLKAQAAAKCVSEIRSGFDPPEAAPVTLSSAKSGSGFGELAAQVEEWTGARLVRPDGSRWD